MGPREPRLKPLSDQVVVITRASSSIGLATAQIAPARGATVVLTSRDDVDLRRVVDEIRATGGTASSVVADVLMAATHRLFQTNDFGVVHGSLVAVRHLREAGGALINALWEAFAPRLGDRVTDTTQVEGQPAGRTAKGGGILFHPRPRDGRHA